MTPATLARDPTEIDISDLELPSVSQQAAEAIDRSNVPPILFRFGGVPVRIETEGDVTTMRTVTPDILRHHLARWASWTRYSSRVRGHVPAVPPEVVVRDLLASPDLPLPRIRRIVHAPTFDRTGMLCQTPGYYGPAAGIYYASTGLHTLSVDQMTVDQARALIVDELLGDFPFTGDAERAHAVALLLLPFARDLIDGPTPLHLIEKPAPGTGATLLVTALLWPALGRDVALLTEGGNEEEWRKRLFAKLSTSPIVTVIDNLRNRLDSAALASILTARTVEDRLLGTTTMLTAPVTCAWVATGNNPALSNEIARRTVRIRLDAQVNRPWLREGFRHPDLRRWMQLHWAELASAAVILIGDWIQAGSPWGDKRMGQFEAWSQTMGGILANAGIAGFLDNLSEFYDSSDDDTATWTAIVAAWAAEYGTKAVGVGDLFKLVTPDLGLDLGDKNERSQRTRLGKSVSSMRDRCFAGYRIVTAPPVNNTARWKLTPQP
jgi:hypothetical protein